MASHDRVSSLSALGLWYIIRPSDDLTDGHSKVDFQYLNMKRASDGLTDLNIKCPSYRLTDGYSNTKDPSEQIPYVYQTSV